MGHTAAVGVRRAPLAFQASENPGIVVVQLTQDVGVEADDTPLLRIYGDGRVLVHFPVYMRRAGTTGSDWIRQSSTGCSRPLCRGDWLISASSACARRSAKCAAPAGAAHLEMGGPAALTTRSDDVVVSIDVRFGRYTDADGAVRQNVETRASWSGLQFDAAEFPGVASLQSLATIERRLIGLTNHLARRAPPLPSVSPRSACWPPRARSSRGGYIFAGDANGLDSITHPQGYTGTGGPLNISVVIDPTSNNGSAMEISVQNIVTTFNGLVATTGNLVIGGGNNIPSNALDFESIALHELGHSLGLAHSNAASESELSGSDQNYTKATDGVDNMFNLNDGADNVIGSSDDIRGDDINLHWFRHVK